MKSPIPAAEFAEQFPIPHQNPFGDDADGVGVTDATPAPLAFRRFAIRPPDEIVAEFALDESRPLAFFAGIWTRWTWSGGSRKARPPTTCSPF